MPLPGFLLSWVAAGFTFVAVPARAEPSPRDGIVETLLNDGKLTVEIPSTLLSRDLLVIGRITSGTTDPQFPDVPGLGPNHGPIPWTPFANAVVRLARGPADTLVAQKQELTSGRERKPDNGGETLAEVAVVRRTPKGELVVDAEALLQRSKLGFRGKWATTPDAVRFTRVVCLPDRLEVHGVTEGKEGPIGLQWSVAPLPAEPMRPRLADPRVNYSIRGSYIERWRLTKKIPAEPVSAPVDPIVVYLDSSIPDQWRNAVTDGLLQWGRAFEAAGFKNVLTVRQAPTDDPDWSTFDLRRGVTVWWTKGLGGNCWKVSDPRTGELLNAVVTLFGDDMFNAQGEYLMRAGGVDAAAGAWPIPERILENSVRLLAAHEFGHALGFEHNFMSIFPAEKLRDPKWVEREGSAPTVMGYTAYNRVAQPEDRVPIDSGLYPRVGLFDAFATHWGYATLSAGPTPQAEQVVLNQWANAAQDTPWLRFGREEGMSDEDPWRHYPRTDAEWPSWAEEHLLRTRLYMANTRRISDQLAAWNRSGAMAGDLILHFGKLRCDTLKGVAEIMSSPIPARVKLQAFQLLDEEAFSVPPYLYALPLLKRWDERVVFGDLHALQSELLASLLDDKHVKRLVANAAVSGYSLKNLGVDLHRAFWRELDKPRVAVTKPRQMVQKIYLNYLRALAGPAGGLQPDAAPKLAEHLTGEELVVFRDEVSKLSILVRSAVDRSENEETRTHLRSVLKDLTDTEVAP